jgi:succinyl-diaminopimelate desuccinylase
MDLDLKKRIATRVESLREDSIAFLKDLISVPTINPPGENYERCADVFVEKLRSIGVKAKKVQVPKSEISELSSEEQQHSRVNVVAELQGRSKKPDLHLTGHFDVVPAHGSWKTPPFTPSIKDGKMFGRGTSDMKGSLAAMVIAMQALVELDLPLSGTLSFSAVVDEETDGTAGTGYLLKEKHIAPDYCIVGEPSGIDTIWNAHKGSLWMEIKTKGRGAHGSTPWLGINAFEKAMGVIERINSQLVSKEFKKKRSIFPTNDPLGVHPTLTIGGRIRTGSSINIVPNECSISLDRRVIPEETIEEAKNEILDIIADFKAEDPNFDAELIVVSGYDAVSTPTDSQVCQSVINAVKAVIGKQPDVHMCLASFDMRFFVTAGIPSVNYGVGDISLAHTPNEYLKLDDLSIASQVYILSAIDLLQ